MSTSAVARERDFLAYFTKQTPAKRKELIARLQRPQLNSLSEVFSNLLKGNISPRGTHLIKQLHPYRAAIRKLALKKTSLSEKRKILASKRGGNILGLILPVVSRLIKSLLL